jgi:hypothetical protein
MTYVIGPSRKIDDISYVQLSNRFSLLEVDQQNEGLLKHVDKKEKPLVGKKKKS